MCRIWNNSSNELTDLVTSLEEFDMKVKIEVKEETEDPVKMVRINQKLLL